MLSNDILALTSTAPEEAIKLYETMYLTELMSLVPTLITWKCSNPDERYDIVSGDTEQILRLGSGIAVWGYDTGNKFTLLSDNLRAPFRGKDPLYPFTPNSFGIPGGNKGPNIVVTNQTPYFNQYQEYNNLQRSLVPRASTDLATLRVAAHEMAVLRYLRYMNGIQLNTQAFISGPNVQSADSLEAAISSMSPFVKTIPWNDQAGSNFIDARITTHKVSPVDLMSSFSQQIDQVFRDAMIRLGVPAIDNANERRVNAEVEMLKSVPEVFASSFQNPREEVANMVEDMFGYKITPTFSMRFDYSSINDTNAGNDDIRNIAKKLKKVLGT